MPGFRKFQFVMVVKGRHKGEAGTVVRTMDNGANVEIEMGGMRKTLPASCLEDFDPTAGEN